jgi:hypothetical protein
MLDSSSGADKAEIEDLSEYARCFLKQWRWVQRCCCDVEAKAGEGEQLQAETLTALPYRQGKEDVEPKPQQQSTNSM